MIVKLYVDDPRMLKLCKQTVAQTGAATSEMDRDEVCRSDVTLLLFSFTGESLDDIVESHPYNRILIVGPVGITNRNIRYFSSPEDIVPVLSVMNHRESKSALPMVTSSHKQHRLRKRIAKVKCPFCEKDIGGVALGLENHLVACRKYLNRPAAFGSMVLERQPNGRSKGSFLTVYIPEAIQVNDVYLKPGLHMITDGPLIKILNAVLRDTFRYTLEKEEHS